MADDQGAGAPAGGQPVTAEAPGARQRTQTRKRMFTLLGGVVVAAAVVFALWYLLVASHYVSTDDSYVGADVAQVTPLVAGAVSAVRVADTQAVKAGDVLVEIDPADANLALARAQADYDRAVRSIREDVATQGSLSAQVSGRAADIARAQAQVAAARSQLDRAKIDYDRRQALASSGAVSGEELTSSKNAFLSAQADVTAAQAAAAQADASRQAAEGQLAAQAVMTEGPIENNPQVQAARAALNTAQLDLRRTVIRAPIDGVIVRRQVQLGQRIQPGSQLMTIVPTTQVYVDANFKEGQLHKVRIGQPVVLESDLYGGGVKFHGRVVGLGGGTGSAFALIPAQNATGNWIKVVQRLPVRIALDAHDLTEHPLRVGLSMKATIDVAGSGAQR
jgi:membrane fusion protein (multidrug efflux system)